MDSPLSAVSPFLRMYSGGIVNILTPKQDQIKIRDIAWHLARTCRFNGHLNCWYSNAEHSINCAIKGQLHSVELARYCLIHDASEFVFADVPSPVKQLCPDYKFLSDKFQEWLYTHFTTGFNKSLEQMTSFIDKKVCASEMKYLRGQPVEQLEAEPYEPGDISFYKWEWRVAYDQYMINFNRLFSEYKE